MTVRADSYQVVIRFARLFPDPAVFDDQEHLVRKLFSQSQLPEVKMSYLHQHAGEITPVDDEGHPAIASGTAKYQLEGRTIMAEFMSNANLRIEYLDFGTGLSPDDHLKLWRRHRLGEMRFELREFNHQSQTLSIPNIPELYRLLKEKGASTTLSNVELSNASDNVFEATVAYLEAQLRELANKDNMEVEVYAARNLSNSEKQSLEKRLTRESTRSTIYVILSRPSLSTRQTEIKPDPESSESIGEE